MVLSVCESELHFGRWFHSKQRKGMVPLFALSILVHAVLFFTLSMMKRQEIASFSEGSSPQVNITLKENKKESPHMVPSEPTKPLNPIPKNVLTAPHNAPVTQAIPTPRSVQAPMKSPMARSLNDFLPRSDSSFLQGVRDEAKPELLNADSGDIPISNAAPVPQNGPIVQKRFGEKDLSLFQFSEEFRSRFSSIWNLKERFVPPASPLRPGDVVYYKVFISPDGSLEKFENVSQQKDRFKNFSDIDSIFSEVVTQVFPMTVPSKFARHVITQLVAIQVVDRHSPIRFSF